MHYKCYFILHEAGHPLQPTLDWHGQAEPAPASAGSRGRPRELRVVLGPSGGAGTLSVVTVVTVTVVTVTVVTVAVVTVAVATVAVATVISSMACISVVTCRGQDTESRGRESCREQAEHAPVRAAHSRACTCHQDWSNASNWKVLCLV